MENKIKVAQFEKGPKYAVDELKKQILDWTAQTGANGGVVGLSGGVDSTATAYLCKLAFDEHNKTNENKLNLFGLVMPSNSNDPSDAKDGIRVANALNVGYEVVPIQSMADAFVNVMPSVLNKEFDVGNLYAELRAVTLSRYGAAKNSRVMGTGNYDEDYVLGYFTKRGDGAVDNNILGNLPKHLVRELASYMGAPSDLVGRVSTAGLWEGQTDENELGYTYMQAHVIQNGYDLGMNQKEIQKETGYDLNIIKNVAYRHLTTQHKREAPPVGIVSLVME